MTVLCPMLIDAQCAEIIYEMSVSPDYDLSSHWDYVVGDGCQHGQCGWGHNELQYYSPEAISVTEDKIYLTAKRESMGTALYTSGAMISKQAYEIGDSGQIGLEFDLPKAKGVGLRIFLVGMDVPVEEVFGAEQLSLLSYVHTTEPSITIGAKPWMGGVIDNTQRRSSNLVVSWIGSTMVWSFNGVKVHEGNVPSHMMQKQLKLVIAMSVGGYINTNPNGASIFPDTFSLSYIALSDRANTSYLVGPNQVIAGKHDVMYAIQNPGNDYTITWTWGSGMAREVAADSNMVIVQWKDQPGWLEASLTNQCYKQNLYMYITTLDGLSKRFSLLNYDESQRLNYDYASGFLNEYIANPQPSITNLSSLCAAYIRNDTQRYDVLFYDIVSGPEYPALETGEQMMYIDLLTTAPMGTEIILQYEDKEVALPDNFPMGRHSRYLGYTGRPGEWQRIPLSFLDKLDTLVMHAEINSVVLLLAPNTLTGDIYYLDNIDIYGTYVNTVFDRDNMHSSLKPYPNPFDNEIQLGQVYAKVALFDMQGKSLILEENVDRINAERLEMGAYIINCIDSQGKGSQALIIKR